MMAKDSFINLIKARIAEMAFKYLIDKRRSKGKEIHYEKLEMADYLMPYNSKLSIEDKRKLFSIRNRMTEIGNNFGQKENCINCQKNENSEHIYSCKFLNKQENEIPYERIYNGNITEQIKVMKIFEQNMETRNQIIKNKQFPCDPVRDPLNFVQFSNG